jgi:hypothetical protein
MTKPFDEQPDNNLSSASAIGDTRLDWIAPEVRAMSVKETALRPNTGHDGETIWTDCTLS